MAGSAVTTAQQASMSGHMFALYQNLGEHDFPLELLLAGELAQFETYAIPSISQLLHRTAHYEKEGLKRLDDTRATLTDILSYPPGHPTRQTMVHHLNWVHGHYRISNDDYLYTLMQLFLKPLAWIQKWGWRRLGEDELAAVVEAMLAVGRDMNIQIEDPSLEGLLAWQAQYRQQHAAYDPANQAVSEGTMRGLGEHLPRWLRPFVPAVVAALLDDRQLLSRLGMAPPRREVRWLVLVTLRGWQGLSRVYRPWRKRKFSESRIANYYPSYPGGRLDYHLLGPRKLVARRNEQGRCPFG